MESYIIEEGTYCTFKQASDRTGNSIDPDTFRTVLYCTGHGNAHEQERVTSLPVSPGGDRHPAGFTHKSG
jgi:hypothetical protein